MPATETPTAEAALAYLERGWSVIPLNGKLPRVSWEQYIATRPTRDQVEAWWTEWPDAGIGVCLGQVSGIIRIDADGDGAMAELERLGGVPDTAEFMTPAGGRGWLLQYMDGCVTERVWKGSGQHQEVRVQSTGAYSVVPPSPHPNGGFYQWVREKPFAPVPLWLRDRVVERVLRDLVRELRPTLKQPDTSEVLLALHNIRSFDDYDMWIRVGLALHSAEEDYLEAWINWSKQSVDKFKEGECERKWASFSSIGGGLTIRSLFYFAEKESNWKPSGRHEQITDLGNARVLAAMGEGKIKWSEKWGWLHWDRARWAEEGAVNAVTRLQMQVLEHRRDTAIQSLAKHYKSDQNAPDYQAILKRKERAVKLIRRHEEEPKIRGARKLAEALLEVNYRLFDRKPYLHNCVNGTFDSQTGEFRSQHDPTDMLKQVCPTPYDPNAECPKFLKFLEEILPDESVRGFMHQFLGSCLTGDVSADVMPILWGSGANGKSTLVETVMHVLGEDYAMKAKRDLLIVKRGNEHPTSIARLHGKRFVACVESDERSRLDETFVKEMTGGDKIAARRMREDEWEFPPTHKIVYATNHKPEIIGTDDGIWRRIRLVPFEQQFLPDDPRRDPGLKEALKEEAPGILRWMAEGCKEWLANDRRFVLPEAVKNATREYREEQDSIGRFLAECYAKCSEGKVRIEFVRSKYKEWCLANREYEQNATRFGKAIRRLGYDANKHYYLGLRLRRSDE